MAEHSKEGRRELIQMRISADLKAKAQERAEEEGRSLSNYIEWLIRKDLRECTK